MASLAFALALTACNATPMPGQPDDTRYADDNTELAAPNATEATDGTQIQAPDGYVPAFTKVKEENEVIKEEFEQPIEVEGVKYTFHSPSKVHASKTYEGRDSFFVDVEIESDDVYNLRNSGAMFFYAPNGLYTNDLIQQSKDDEKINKIMELEKKGEKIPDDIYTDDTDLGDIDGNKLNRRLELAYDGDGDYTIEVRDFINNKLHRITFKVTLK